MTNFDKFKNNHSKENEIALLDSVKYVLKKSRDYLKNAFIDTNKGDANSQYVKQDQARRWIKESLSGIEFPNIENLNGVKDIINDFINQLPSLKDLNDLTQTNMQRSIDQLSTVIAKKTKCSTIFF